MTTTGSNNKSKQDAPVIESTDQLAAYLAEGCKPKEEWRIGTEHEKFVFCRTNLKPNTLMLNQAIATVFN